MQKLSKILTFIRRQPRWRLITAAGILVAGALFLWHSGGGSAGKSPTFVSRRGPLDISVLEYGSLQALESQEIKCEVRVGYQGTKILKIIEEGYLVTEEDVRTNKVLVELDSSELQKQIVQQEIQYQSAAANLTDAQQGYEIQLGQNQSDIKTAEQKARFARMDFDKLLGDVVTAEIVKESGLDDFLAIISTNGLEQAAANAAEKLAESAPSNRPPQPAPDGANGPAAEPKVTVDAKGASIQPIKFTAQTAPEKSENVKIEAPKADPGKKPADKADATAAQGVKLDLASFDPSALRPTPPGSSPQPGAPDGASASEPAPAAAMDVLRLTPVDFTKYADTNVLGDGEAMQKMRKFEDDLRVAEKERGQADTALEGTRRLFDKGFAPKNEITRDEITDESARLKVQTAKTAQALYIKYEFPKSAEEALSKYAEGVRELDKARRVAISKMAQATAKLNSAKGQYEVQVRQRKDLSDQLAKCILSAKKSGLVVYGSGRDDGYDREPMREGATVRERQTMITIPDMTRMAVNVKIHESYIKKVKKGQKARLTVDAFPDQPLSGEITKVGVLPDSQNRWLSPDLKVYLTTIAIDGTNDWVKPGMSSKVEILVDHLDDVVYVPMQTISPEDGKQYCYVISGFKTDKREVEIGQFNDNFIEIKKGLKEGERVLLNPPKASEDGSKEAKPDEKAPGNKAPENKPKEPAAVAADPAKSGKT